jgi:hypothetical protein
MRVLILGWFSLVNVFAGQKYLSIFIAGGISHFAVD